MKHSQQHRYRAVSTAQKRLRHRPVSYPQYGWANGLAGSVHFNCLHKCMRLRAQRGPWTANVTQLGQVWARFHVGFTTFLNLTCDFWPRALKAEPTCELTEQAPSRLQNKLVPQTKVLFSYRFLNVPEAGSRGQ